MLRWIAVLVLVAGCSSKDREPPTPTATDEAAPAAVPVIDARPAPAAIPAGPKGAVQGRVTLTGAPPQARAVEAGSDPFCARAGVRDESVIVDEGGGLRDAVVRVSPTAFRVPPPATPVVITQEACRYAPRVSVAVEGQSIEVRNADDTVHNVHGYDVRGEGEARALYNEAQIAGAAPIVKPTVGREIVKLTCDIHPWMRGYVVVSPHGFAAVTGADGSYAITGIPPGSYELEIWHPQLGRLTHDVRVTADEISTVDVRYHP